MLKKEHNACDVGILGCGWLGIPLAKQLVEEGYRVRGSARKTKQLKRIEAVKATAFQVNCTEDGCVNCSSFFEGLEVLIIALPPGLRKNPSARFDRVMEHIIDALISAKIKKVIFISSTSVYGEQVGIITEENLPSPTTESGKQLVKCEEFLLCNENFESVILRFGGLIGANRNPIHQVVKKPFIANPSDVINFIHQKDCVQLISRCIRYFRAGERYNGVTPYHPKRKDFYQQMADLHGLTCPPFKEIRAGKRLISSAKAQEHLGGVFSVENLLT